MTEEAVLQAELKKRLMDWNTVYGSRQTNEFREEFEREIKKLQEKLKFLERARKAKNAYQSQVKAAKYYFIFQHKHKSKPRRRSLCKSKSRKRSSRRPTKRSSKRSR